MLGKSGEQKLFGMGTKDTILWVGLKEREVKENWQEHCLPRGPEKKCCGGVMMKGGSKKGSLERKAVVEKSDAREPGERAILTGGRRAKMHQGEGEKKS